MAESNSTSKPESLPSTPGPGPHGHPNPMYCGYWKRGCRCAECVATHRKYQRDYIAGRTRDDPDYQAKTRLKHLQQPGAAEAIRRRGREYSKRPAEQARCLAKSRAKTIERRDLLAAIKLERGCADCGYKGHFAALDFDHVSGEKFLNVAMMGTFSLDRIMEEVAKCEVVCFRCHRIRERARMLRGELDWASKRGDKPTRSHARSLKCRDRGKAFLANLKLEHGCKDCGYKDRPEAMDFDHVRGEKLFSLANRHGTSIAKLTAEAAKCDVVCANCHRVRTFNRKQSVSDPAAA